MRKVDFIVIGSGFAGSIMAMILRRLGRSVVMLEKGRHPRFAIGESSTPLANLLLEELARKYELPDLATFSKWGAWQAAHPEIACGLKRGFTFYKHEWGELVDFEDRGQQLLVAASPHDRIADTHWYRPDFDAHMARKAQELGADLHEDAQFDLEETAEGWFFKGQSNRGRFEVAADFLIDATGSRGALFTHLAMTEDEEWNASFPRTEALFAHFREVKRLGPRCAEPPPFPPDDAAVHHIFDGGWIWVLRFNNGMTSAGVAATAPLASELRLHEGAAAWTRLLNRLPTVKAQFENATAVTPFFHQPKLAFCAPRAVGRNWAMLPSAFGFVDPLFSTGFVLTLLGISRLAEIIASGTNVQSALEHYEKLSRLELNFVAALVRAAYSKFADFAAFSDLARVYFAAAIWSETIRRLGNGSPDFLLAGDKFGMDAATLFRDVANLSSDQVRERVRMIVEPYDLAALCDVSRRNWHPALASDLFSNAAKIPANAKEIGEMLSRCGF